MGTQRGKLNNLAAFSLVAYQGTLVFTALEEEETKTRRDDCFI